MDGNSIQQMPSKRRLVTGRWAARKPHAARTLRRDHSQKDAQALHRRKPRSKRRISQTRAGSGLPPNPFYGRDRRRTKAADTLPREGRRRAPEQRRKGQAGIRQRRRAKQKTPR